MVVINVKFLNENTGNVLITSPICTVIPGIRGFVEITRGYTSPVLKA